MSAYTNYLKRLKPYERKKAIKKFWVKRRAQLAWAKQLSRP